MKRLISVFLCCSMLFTLVPSIVFAETQTGDLSELITYEQPKDAFDYTIPSDPMQLSDEDFLGQWDESVQAWIEKPYFDYDKYEGLTPVKEAVKKGDYKTAKNELLEYYRSVSDDRGNPATTHPGTTALLQAEGLEKNVYAVNEQNGATQGFFKVNNEWNEYRINVFNSFGASVIGSESFRGFILMSVDKYLTEAEFYARESKNPPMLELTVNGMAVSIPAAKDAMVRGGEYGTENYGHDKIMTVQESGTYLNFNENTKRAYIAFDISFLKTTDIVTSATLVVNGRNASGTGEKEIMVYRLNDMSFDENTIAFNDYTDCMLWSCNDENAWDYITSNSTTIKGKACFYHRGKELLRIANLYSYLGNERYAFTFIRNHMAMVNSVGFNLDVFNALDLSTQINYGSESVLKVIHSKYMTGEIFTAMLKTFWLQANYLVNTYYGTAYNNWGSYATLGVYALLARFREFTVYDDWYAPTVKENTRLISTFTFKDGMCLELSIAYVITVLTTLYGPFEVEILTGVPVPYDELVWGQCHSIVKNLIYASSPSGGGFNFADSQDYNSGTSKKRIDQWYKNVFIDDEELAYVATNGHIGKLPDNPTTHYPVGLRTYMRSSWDEDALALAITAKGVGSHGHFDMLSLSMFAYGQYLLTDQGYGGILTGDIREYMISAPQHNIVSVNGENYGGQRDGFEKAFETNRLYDFVEYYGKFYDNILQQRSVLFLKDMNFWIVTDFARPDDVSTTYSFEQNWHMLPSANMEIDENTHIVRSNFDGANVMVVPVGTSDITSYTEDSKFAPSGGSIVDNKKAVIKKEKSGDTVFTTLIIPENANEEFVAQAVNLNTGIDSNVVSATHFKITDVKKDKADHYYYYHLNDLDKKQDITLGVYKTDATTALIQTDENGKIKSIFLMDAKYLEDTTAEEPVLFKSETAVGVISYKINGELISIYSSTIDEEQLEGMTIYVGNKKNAKLNSKMLDGKKSGGYLYFGDEPIIKGTVIPEEDTGNSDNSSDSGNHGTGGGSSGGGGGGGGAAVIPPVNDKPDEENKPGEEVVTPVEPEIPENIADEIDGHWGKEQIKALYKDGVIKGDSEGLRLMDTISRAEFTALMVRALGLQTKEYKNTFTDVGSQNWYASCIATAYDAGLINGADGMFRPNDTITREEICKIIASALNAETELKELGFSDNANISSWAVLSVQKVFSLGIVNGMDDGSFAPKNNALREQAFVMLARLTEKLN